MRIGFRLRLKRAAERRERAAAVEAHQRAHVLRRHQARGAFARKRRGLDALAIRQARQRRRRRGLRPAARLRGSATARAGAAFGRPAPPRRPHAGGSGCRGSSPAIAYSGGRIRSKPTRADVDRLLARSSARARDRMRSPSSSPSSTSGTQVISFIAGTSRELIETEQPRLALARNQRHAPAQPRDEIGEIRRGRSARRRRRRSARPSSRWRP